MEYVLAIMLGALIGFRMSQVIYSRKEKILYEQIDKYQKVKNGNKLPESILEDKLWHEGETDFVFKLLGKLTLTTNKGGIARQIVESVYKFIYAERVILLFLDKNIDKTLRTGGPIPADQFVIGYSIGLDENVASKFVLKKTESISGYVAANRKTLVVNNLDEEDYLKRINKEPYFNKSFIEVPIIMQEEIPDREILGALIVCDKKPGRPFTRKDENLLENVGKVCAIALKNSQLHDEIQDDYLKTITAFAAAIDARDTYTRQHSENVMRYSVEIGRVMGFSFRRIENLRRAALLHDIGKIGIPDSILLKNGKLTPDEFKQIKMHPEKGESIIKNLPFLKEIALFIRHHHERYDGKGYPDGIKGEKIELEARILTVADSFDAMISNRPYRKAMPLNEAINQLEINKGTQFSPEVVDCFLSILKNNPGIIQLQNP